MIESDESVISFNKNAYLSFDVSLFNNILNLTASVSDMVFKSESKKPQS